ncbi:MAG: aldose epimerase family protein [Rikenellaceae bacterium]
MSIEKVTFGTLQSGDVTLYKIKNSSGMEVHIMDYGVIITSILIPNEDGSKDNIVCGFNNLNGYFSDEYKANAPFFGAMIGRYCSTIKDAKYADVVLTANCDTHNLHGGTVGFDKRMWDLKSSDESSLTFSILSVDGDQGYPGEVNAEVTIELSDDNALSFSYNATSTKRTPFSMTNHTYFNLSAFRDNIESHTVQVDSSVRIPLLSEGTFDENCVSVAGEVDDLTTMKNIGDVHKAMGGGFEHYFLYEGGMQSTARKVATFAYAPLNRSVDVLTTEYGGLFYTGIYTSDKLQRESGEKYGKFRALCFETHRVPNGPNLEGTPAIMLDEGEQFKSQTIFKFNF